MSNLEPEDIYEYHERRNNGLFQVEEVTIESYNDCGELEDEPKIGYAVVSKLAGTTISYYTVNTKELAEDICGQMNLLTHDLGFEKVMPGELLVKNDSELYDLANILNEKNEKLGELATSIENELNLELNYLHKSNALKLDPNKIKEELELTKLPTEKQINAYIENKLALEYDLWKIAKANTSLLRQQLDYINDRISFEKHSLRLRWIK